jgi:Domain of unknown function (DUF6436)
MRKVFVISWLLSLLLGIILVFWFNEWVYARPTPVPKNYTAVRTGSLMQLPGITDTNSHKPLFLHFFNPDCPCSKFNLAHVKMLIKKYGSDANFTLVLVTAKNYSAAEIQERFAISIPVIPNNGLSERCGVYSTPQAVIIDDQQQLYYRGNYNRSRYCADKKTNYAQAALETLLQKNEPIKFELLAVKAYGCQLPGCTKE